MVQLPEPTPPGSAANSAGFASIAEIGKQRIRHVVSETVNKQAEQLPLDGSNSETIGFRVYRLDRTHFKPWTDYSGDDVAMLQAQFDAFESPLVDGWKPDDLLVEIMLTEGFPLDSAVTRQPQFAANDVRLVESDFHEHRLWVCLDQRVEPSTASALAMADNDVFICLDGAVGDEMKLRLSDSGNLKTI
jgi:adenine-specific DNA-methyltransferase